MAEPPTAVRIGRGGAFPGTARTGEAGWTHVVPRAAARDRAVASSLAAQPRTPCRRPAQGADGVGVDRGAFLGGQCCRSGLVWLGSGPVGCDARSTEIVCATTISRCHWSVRSPLGTWKSKTAVLDPPRTAVCAVPPRGIKRCLIGGCRRTRSRWTHPRISGVKLASIRTR